MILPWDLMALPIYNSAKMISHFYLLVTTCKNKTSYFCYKLWTQGSAVLSSVAFDEPTHSQTSSDKVLTIIILYGSDTAANYRCEQLD